MANCGFERLPAADTFPRDRRPRDPGSWCWSRRLRGGREASTRGPSSMGWARPYWKSASPEVESGGARRCCTRARPARRFCASSSPKPARLGEWPIRPSRTRGGRRPVVLRAPFRRGGGGLEDRPLAWAEGAPASARARDCPAWGWRDVLGGGVPRSAATKPRPYRGSSGTGSSARRRGGPSPSRRMLRRVRGPVAGDKGRVGGVGGWRSREETLPPRGPHWSLLDSFRVHCTIRRTRHLGRGSDEALDPFVGVVLRSAAQGRVHRRLDRRRGRCSRITPALPLGWSRRAGPHTGHAPPLDREMVAFCSARARRCVRSSPRGLSSVLPHRRAAGARRGAVCRSPVWASWSSALSRGRLRPLPRARVQRTPFDAGKALVADHPLARLWGGLSTQAAPPGHAVRPLPRRRSGPARLAAPVARLAGCGPASESPSLP